MRLLAYLFVCVVLANGPVLLAGAQQPLSAAGPTATFDDAEVWLYHARHDNEVVARGHAYAPDGNLAAITVGVATWGRTTTAAVGTHASGAHSFNPQAPGAYVGIVEARTTSGAVARDTGVFDVRLVPFDPSSVPGFPPLGEVEEPATTMSYAIQLIVRQDGTVKAYSVSVGGQVQMDTLMDASIEPGDRDVVIEFNRFVATAQMRVDGQLDWSGTVRQTGTAWWHVVPVAELGALGPDA